MMFIWGGVLLLAFLTPTKIDPELQFHWNTIIDGEGTQKLGPLIIAAAGLLSILLAIIPTSPAPRGMIAGLLGMTGIVLPNLLRLSKGDFDLKQILEITVILGFLTIVPGLLIRNEYRESIAGRLLTTLGVLCMLAMYLVPVNEKMAIVSAFDMIIDGEGKGKVEGIVRLGPVVLSVLSLLVWLPAPSSGGAKVFAWLWITWVAVELLTMLLVLGAIGDRVTASPFAALMSWAPTSAFLVLVGYGFATVIGKKLE